MTPVAAARRGPGRLRRRTRTCAAIALYGLSAVALAHLEATRVVVPPPQAIESAPLRTTAPPARPLPATRPASSARTAPAAPAPGVAAPVPVRRAASAALPHKPVAAAPAAPAPAAAAAPRRDTAAALNALDTRLVAERTAGPVAGRNAFQARTWTLPPPPPPVAASAPPPPPPPPPPPVAPPMPFKYMGMLQESPSRTLWYLLAGDRLLVGARGDVIDNNYRIEGVEAGKLQLTYLPLKQRQSLAIGVLP